MNNKVIRLIITLIGFLYILKSNANCDDHGIYVFPYQHLIHQNSIFVITGYMNSQDIILQLNKKYRIYLKSGDQKINLLVTEICTGQIKLTQAILKPEFKLKAGLEYMMMIDSLPEFERLEKFNKFEGFKEVTYQVIAETDKDIPQLSTKPKELQKKLYYYGCGPSIHVDFSQPATDRSEIIVRTTLKNLETGMKSTFYIEPDEGLIKVGRDMCSGAFDLFEGDLFEVEFTFMDSCGNKAKWKGKGIRFTRPTNTCTDYEND